MSFPTRGIRAYSPILVPIALLLHIGIAAAAGSADSPLEQQRAWLTGRPATVAAGPGTTPRSDTRAVRSIGDAQEHARRLLLDLPIRTQSARQASVSEVRGNHRFGDAQALARQVLLGRSNAAVAGS
jgi:hypothetical protein